MRGVRDKSRDARYNLVSMLSANTTPVKAPLSPPDQTLIAQAVGTRLPPGLVFQSLTPLAGDASNRRYFRATVGGGPPHSVIVMQLAEPEGFKQSEEVVSGGIHQISELPFINIMSHLAKAKVPVPALH